MDVVQADAQIDAFIERRSRQSTEQRPEEVMYAESVRRYHARRRDERLWERLRYHEAMLEAHTRTFQAMLDKHKAGRERCEQMLGIDNERTEGAA
jgi:flagellar motor switch protein FliM